MPSILTQIYEIQTPAEADLAVNLGVDHIGGVVLSPERINDPVLRDTVRFIQGAGRQSSLIPLFSQPEPVFRMLEFYRPDIVHFCEALPLDGAGEFAPWLTLQATVRSRFPEIKIMRSLPIPVHGRVEDCAAVLKLAHVFAPLSDYFLTDTLTGAAIDQPVSGFVGITGRTCDWKIASGLVRTSGIPVILAGGLGPENVYQGIQAVWPAGVDSCTLTNATDREGRPVRFQKDPDRLRRFIREARRADRN